VKDHQVARRHPLDHDLEQRTSECARRTDVQVRSRPALTSWLVELIHDQVEVLHRMYGVLIGDAVLVRALRPPDGHRKNGLQNRGSVVRTIAGGRPPARPFRAAATTERVCTPKPTLIGCSSSSSVNALVATATPTRRPRSPDPQMRIGGAGRCPLVPCVLARPAGRVLVPHDRRMAPLVLVLAVPSCAISTRSVFCLRRAVPSAPPLIAV
jgi:hypothetical protein